MTSVSPQPTTAARAPAKIAERVSLSTGDASNAVQLAAIKAQDPTLDDITQDAIAYAKYTIMAAAAGVAGSGNDFADAARAFVTSRKPKAKAAYQAKAKELLATPQTRQAQFGHYATLEPAAMLSLSRNDAVKQVRGASFAKAGSLSLDKLHALSIANDIRLDKKPGAPAAKKKPEDPDLKAGLEYKWLECYLDEVRCVESTGGLFEGDDELMIGGVAVGARGKVGEVAQFFVSEMDDGKLYVFNGGHVFARYPLVTNIGWPTVYAATISMADQDDGGFGTFIEKLWEKVGSYVTSAIGAAAGTALGAAIGSAIPGLGTVIGAVVGAIIGWLVSLFHNDDDIIGTQTSTMSLGADTKSYYDWAKLTTADGWTQTLTYNQGEGQYRLRIGWRVKKS